MADKKEELEKVSRAAFIYLGPKNRDNNDDFAQCATCRMFVGSLDRCIIHGSFVKVDEDDSCGFFVDWPTKDGKPNSKVVADHKAELEKEIAGSVAPEESGLVDDRVQCHRCEFFDADKSLCGLYAKLNKSAEAIVSFDPHVEPHGCCNAWTEKVDGRDATKDRRSRRQKALYKGKS